MVICHSQPALATAYDGIWFLGFNILKPPFDNVKVREAVAHTIALGSLSANIFGETKQTASYVPPGMPGYDDTLKPFKLNIKYAKTLMKRAKYALNNPLLKNITLLHTDGVKTTMAAQKIQKDLKQIGINVTLVQMSYWDEAGWNRELESKKHQLFLMGYKAELNKLYTQEAAAGETDTANLLEPLFKSGGEANLTGYSNPTVDMMLDQTAVIAPTMRTERDLKFREINRLLYKDIPLLVLFYIEKL
ncbi:MAG TPA: ABC transporter substrate-binding protein [Candidatus Sulfotelmatobacter sp.]|nr:ABC transporter substrate-binding protein [Candidatus Sulfotelmatobacter sp.]